MSHVAMIMIVIKILVALGLLIGLIQSGRLNVNGVPESFFSLGHLGVMVLILANYGAQIFRWSLLLRTQDFTQSFWWISRIFFIGQFFFMTSLGAVVGEAARGYYVIKHAGEGKFGSASTVLVDRMMGLFSYLALGALAFVVMVGRGLVSPDILWMGLVSWILLVGMLLFLYLLFLSATERLLQFFLPTGWIVSTRMALMGYRTKGGVVVRALVCSFGSSFFLLTAFWAASHLLGGYVTWLQVFLIVPFVIIANSLPVSIGGLGVGETVAQVLMAQVGMADGAMVMLFIRITMWCLVLPSGGMFFVLERK
ncbi:MAG: flippase-like domain-containing protein [Magnetococcus sp. XQGC-1]